MSNQPLELNERRFKPLSQKQDAELIARPSITFWQAVWRRLKQNPVAMTSLMYVILITIFAIVVPMFSQYADIGLDTQSKNIAPNAERWFGTDDFGRDLFVRVWQGARISLFIAFTAAFIDLTLGILIGGLAGYIGGKIDNFIMRVIEILVGIPYLIFVILLMIILGAGIVPMIASTVDASVAIR